MKIALVTASIGGIDEILPMPEQSISFDYFCYTETNLPFPMTELSDRMKSRYLKLRMHEYLPGYDAYVWIDGRAEIISRDFVQSMVNWLKENDIVITEHEHRQTTDEEYKFILTLMDEGSKYLLSRYNKGAIVKESTKIPNSKLYAFGVFAYKPKPLMEMIFDRMFNFCIKNTSYDQGFGSYLLSIFDLKVKAIKYDLIKIGKHKK